MRKRKRPKGLFEGNRLSLEAVRMIDRVTEDLPALRTAMYESFAAMSQPETMETFARASPAQRAELLLALRGACKALLERKACDLCGRIASTVRFVLIGPDADIEPVKRPNGGEALIMFTVLCNQCVQIPPEHRDKKLLAELARLQQQRGTAVPRRRPAIIGKRVGAGATLAARSALQSCERCGESIWFDQDHLDRFTETDGDAVFVCRNCAEQLLGTGALECVPCALVAPARRDSD